MWNCENKEVNLTILLSNVKKLIFEICENQKNVF